MYILRQKILLQISLGYKDEYGPLLLFIRRNIALRKHVRITFCFPQSFLLFFVQNNDKLAFLNYVVIDHFVVQ